MPDRTPPPFRVLDCALTTLSLGRSARNLRELRDHLSTVEVQSISHHFYDALLRPAFDDPEYRNDFALWTRRQLHDAPLAERLGVIDPGDFDDLEELRQHLIEVVEDRLSEASDVPQAARGKEFHFLKSQRVVLDTGLRAETPEDLGKLIPRLSTGTIYSHVIEVRRRQPHQADEFSAWLAQWGARYEPLCDRIRAVDFHLWSLSEMRDRIAQAFAAEGIGGVQ